MIKGHVKVKKLANSSYQLQRIFFEDLNDFWDCQRIFKRLSWACVPLVGENLRGFFKNFGDSWDFYPEYQTLLPREDISKDLETF